MSLDRDECVGSLKGVGLKASCHAVGAQPSLFENASKRLATWAATPVKTICYDAMERRELEINRLLKSATLATPMTKMQGNEQPTARHERWQGSCAPLHVGHGKATPAARVIRQLSFKHLGQILALQSAADKPPGTYAGLA